MSPFNYKYCISVETSPRMSKKREAPPKPEELIQKLSERLDGVKSNLTGKDID